MMALNPATINSPMELPSMLERLIDIQRAGSLDVRWEIDECVRYAQGMRCEKIQDAMVLMAVARILYGHAIEHAARGEAGALTLMIEGDKLSGRAMVFFEDSTGESLSMGYDRLH